MYFKYGLIIVGAIVIQGLLTYFQVKDYRNNVSQIRKKGRLFIGQTKGKIKAGSIVLMAVDDDGFINEAKSMTGITVFHRFRRIDDLIGKNIFEGDQWLSTLKDKQMAKAISKGIEAMNKNISEDYEDKDSE